MAGLVGGPGGRAHRPQRIFENLQKDSLRKLQKMQYFEENFQKPALDFRAFRRKAQLVWEIFRKFLMKVQ